MIDPISQRTPRKDMLRFGSAFPVLAFVAIFPVVAADKLKLGDREQVEGGMRRTLPSAQCVRRGTQSECSITYKDGSEIGLIYSHNRARGGDELEARLLRQVRPADLASVVRLLGEVGFRDDEVRSCLNYSSADVTLTKIVRHKDITMRCTSVIKPDHSGHVGIDLESIPSSDF